MSNEQFYSPNSEDFLKILDNILFRYNQGIYLPLKEDSKLCVLCLFPIEPGLDAVEMLDFLKEEGIVSRFSNYFHKSCLGFYKARRKCLDAYFGRKGYTFKENLLEFRLNFMIYRSLKSNGVELLS